MASRKSRTGINTVNKRLADGSIRQYFYDRATGRFLGHDREKAMDAAVGSPPKVIPGTFEALCQSYIASRRFTDLKPKSQKLNRLYIRHLCELFGDQPTAAITPEAVESLIERYASRPWYADHLLSKLSVVLQHGVRTGVLKANSASNAGGVNPPKRHELWSREQTAAMIEAAGPDIRLACALLLYTAQRPSDVLAMQWHQVQERSGRTWLTLRQEKTNELVDVPVHRDLAEMLSDAPRRSLLLVPSPTGLPWAYRNFCRSWDKAKVAAGVEGVQRRDLRRTAMVRMAEAGATTAQIAAVSGHTIDQTSRILDTYIPRRSEVAAGAIDAWEANEVRSVVVQMARRKK